MQWHLLLTPRRIGGKVEEFHPQLLKAQNYFFFFLADSTVRTYLVEVGFSPHELRTSAGSRSLGAKSQIQLVHCRLCTDHGIRGLDCRSSHSIIVIFSGPHLKMKDSNLMTSGVFLFTNDVLLLTLVSLCTPLYIDFGWLPSVKRSGAQLPPETSVLCQKR